MYDFFHWLAKLWTHKVHPRIASFVAFFGAFWLGACILVLYVLAKLADGVLEQEAFSFDKTILLDIHRLANPVLDRLMLSITRIGNPQTVVPLTMVVFVFLWWQRYRLEAKVFALNAFGGAVLSYVLKIAFYKPRPDLWPRLITETTFSFPSGHALGSVVLYGFLSYLFATLYPRYDKAFYAIATVLIVAIGFSRLYLGVHWPTDILAGYGIGFLWITVCINLLRLQKAKPHRAVEFES
ncbi:MAG: phosphatase PAP2 family protein [Phormidesmis sp.]